LAARDEPDVIKAVEKIAGAGFKLMELVFEWPWLTHENYQQKVPQLQELKNDLGLEFAVHAPFSYEYFTHNNPALRRFLFAQIENSLLLAEALDSPVLVVHAGRISSMGYHLLKNPVKDSLKIFSESIKPLVDQTQTKICVENIAGGLGKNPEEIKFLLDQTPGLGFCLDFAHAFVQNNLDEFLDSKIVPNHFHLTDNPGPHDSHQTLGTGKIPVSKIKKYLTNKNSYLILEDLTIESATKSKQYLLDSFR